jgi:signal transduction histidine kinase
MAALDPRLRPALLGLAAALALGWVGGWLIARGDLPIWSLVAAAAGAGIWGGTGVARFAKAQSRLIEREAAATARRNRELEWLQRVANTLVSGDDLGQILHEIARAAADLLEAESAAVNLVVEEGRFVRVVAGVGPISRATDSLLPMDGSLLGWVVTSEQPLNVPDMADDPRNYPVADLPLRSMVAVPLRSAGLVVGVLAVFDRRDGRPFTDADVHLLQTLGDQIVVGIDRANVLAESRRNAEDLAAKNRELQRATELKNQFLANMSHELRTPLNAINGFSDLLLTEEVGPLNDMQREFLDSILRNGKHLLGLINSVLDLSKIEAGRMALTLARTDVRELIMGAVTDTASLRAAKRQECRLEIGPDPLPALADGVRIRQILFNLLSNASKFTPEGGSVTVSAVATKAPLPVPAERAGEAPRLMSRDAIWISVRDTGPGIRPEDQPKLFQEFSQVDSSASRQQQGTGLGLALSKKFVEMHGGTIGCESVYGSGSSFWFILPVEGPIRRPPGTVVEPRRASDPGLARAGTAPRSA